MREYSVIYEGTIREEYIILAESKEEARDNFSDGECVMSEVIDGAVDSVEEIK